MEKIVRVGVAVHVKKGDEYLLLKRKSELGTETWCAPGGKVDFGETLEKCGIREFSEEVGGDIRIGEISFLATTNDIFEKEQQHFVTWHFISEYVDGDAKINEPDKFSDIGWFTSNQMEEMNMFLPMKNLLIRGVIK